MSLSDNEIKKFQDMPVDVLIEICGRLNSSDLMAVSLVNKPLYTAALSDPVWRVKWARYFPYKKMPDSGIYKKFTTLFNKTYGSFPARMKKIMCCLMEGRIDALETMQFNFKDLQEFMQMNINIASEEDYKKVPEKFVKDTYRMLRNKHFDQKTLDYLFDKVDKHYEKKLKTASAKEQYFIWDDRFMYAIKLGQSKEVFEKYVKVLKEVGSINELNIVFWLSKSFALAMPMQYNRPELLPTLIELGADVNALNSSALRTALEYGDLDSYKYLIKEGANLKGVNIDDLVDCLNVVGENGHLHVLQYLVDPARKLLFSDEHYIIVLKRSLQTACEYGQLDMAKDLLLKLKEMIPKLEMNTVAAEVFIRAASNNHLEVVKYLYKEYSFDNSVLNSALLLATSTPPYDVVKFLLETNKDFEYEFDLSKFPKSDVSFNKIKVDLFPPKHLDAPSFVVYWKFLTCIAQACHIFRQNNNDKQAAAYLDLANLICKNLNTTKPFETIVTEWKTSKNSNSQYQNETNGAIISTNILTTITSTISNFFSTKTSTADTADAETLINEMVAHAKLYDFAKNLPTYSSSTRKNDD